MPATFYATMLSSGQVTWRPKFSDALGANGPDDGMLVIEFAGNLNKIDWLMRVGDAWMLNLAMLRIEAALFRASWLAGRTWVPVNLVEQGHGVALLTAKVHQQ